MLVEVVAPAKLFVIFSVGPPTAFRIVVVKGLAVIDIASPYRPSTGR